MSDSSPSNPPEKPVRRNPKRKRKARDESPAAEASPSAPSASYGSVGKPGGSDGAKSNGMLYAGVALLVGLGGGYLIRDAQAPKDESAEADPDAAAPASSSSAGPVEVAGPCGEWVTGLCKGAGDSSEACAQARAASKLLPADACTKAIADMPATLARVAAARGTCTTLAERLCADIGEETESCKMVKEKTPSFPTAQCDEMTKNYQAVVDELKRVEKQNAPLTAAEAAEQRAGDAPGFGPVDAKVAIVEYSDFECPYCSKAADAVHQLKEKYKDKVRFVFRQYPLPMHANAPLASEAALAAHAQGKFWELHDAMFENQRALTRESLESYAEKAGLDMAKFRKALDDGTYKAQVQSDMELGKKIGVSGTPTILIGTTRVQNPMDVAGMSATIDAALAGG